MRRYAYKRTYQWSAALAYVLGLFASDGCLANNGRHLILTSKDYELIQYTQDILDVHTKVRLKTGQFDTQAYHFQYSDVALYDFMSTFGITPAKSKTIDKISVPDELYADFLRGYFDGDGTVYGYQDTRWPNSYMYYCEFISASPKFLLWLQSMNQRLTGASPGSIRSGTRAQVLSYAKRDSRKLFDAMYAECDTPRLLRKYTKLRDFIESDPYAKIS